MSLGARHGVLAAVAAIFLLALLWAGVLASGVVIAWLGLRGRAVDRLPRCRSCRYLLIGFGRRPLRCPECGASLTGPEAVRLGRYRTSPPLAALGVVMLLVGASPLALSLARPLAGRAAKPAAGVAPVIVPPAATPLRRPAGWQVTRRARQPEPDRAGAGPATPALAPGFDVDSLFAEDLASRAEPGVAALSLGGATRGVRRQAGVAGPPSLARREPVLVASVPAPVRVASPLTSLVPAEPRRGRAATAALAERIAPVLMVDRKLGCRPD